jgi:hypothetical protein
MYSGPKNVQPQYSNVTVTQNLHLCTRHAYHKALNYLLMSETWQTQICSQFAVLFMMYVQQLTVGRDRL